MQKKGETIIVETHKLLPGNLTREIQYPWWLANVMMVKKPSNNWRMCIVFIDLNKTYALRTLTLIPNVDCLVHDASR